LQSNNIDLKGKERRKVKSFEGMFLRVLKVSTWVVPVIQVFRMMKEEKIQRNCMNYD
jgi:hypothetical protein